MRDGVLDAFAGPGGWDEGARIIGMTDPILGVELDEHACAAAVAAGHRRIRADIRDVQPEDFPEVRGFICSSPCPTFSSAGKRTGTGEDYQVLLDVITHAGQGCDCTWDEIVAELDGVADPRTALAAQAIRFALQLPGLEWLAFEQVPAAELMFEEMAAELTSYDDGGEDSVDADGNWNPDATGSGGYGPGWEDIDLFTIDAVDFGMPVRRRRAFLVGRRYTSMKHLDPSPAHTRGMFDRPSMADALGWGPGHRVRTRGQRRATGGNLFSADGPSWCLTEKARSWTRDPDGLPLDASTAGMLQGFHHGYPWQGARTRQFHQLADVVCPPVAAAVLGHVTNTPWVEPVREHLAGLYGRGQLGLFPTAA